jgi:hypothetical protein
MFKLSSNPPLANGICWSEISVVTMLELKYDWILAGLTDLWDIRGTEINPTARRRNTWTALSLKLAKRDIEVGDGRDGDRIVCGDANS